MKIIKETIICALVGALFAVMFYYGLTLSVPA